MYTLIPSLVNVQPIVHELLQKTFFQETMNLTLNFDPMTLNLLSLVVLNNDYPHIKWHSSPTNSSWVINKNSFSNNCEYDLDLWPNDLDLLPRDSSHQCLPSYQVWSMSDQKYMSCYKNTFFSGDHVFDLDLWPYDLDLNNSVSPHQCLPSHQVAFQSDQ